MSKLGIKPIQIPEKVKVDLKQNSIAISGPLGELSLTIPLQLKVELADKKIFVKRFDDLQQTKALHGTYRSHINNMVRGVSSGFKKILEVVGMGFRAQMQGDKLVMQIGFSHPVEFKVPKNVRVTVDKQNTIIVEGIDKQIVGEVAASIRALKPPEPYKATGIRYSNEYIYRKAGKVAVTTTGKK